MAVPTDVSNPQVYEICSAGPVMIYYAEKNPSANMNRSSEKEKQKGNETENSLAFRIYHGWQPLLMSTAHCFSRIICQSRPPVIVSGCIELFLQGANIRVYLLGRCKVYRNKKNKKVEEKDIDRCEMPSGGVVNISSCKMNKFGDSMEAWILDGMTVYCQGGQDISYSKEAEATIYRVKKNK